MAHVSPSLFSLSCPRNLQLPLTLHGTVVLAKTCFNCPWKVPHPLLIFNHLVQEACDEQLLETPATVCWQGDVSVTAVDSAKAANDPLALAAEETPLCLLLVFLSMLRVFKQG